VDLRASTFFSRFRQYTADGSSVDIWFSRLEQFQVYSYILGTFDCSVVNRNPYSFSDTMDWGKECNFFHLLCHSIGAHTLALSCTLTAIFADIGIARIILWEDPKRPGSSDNYFWESSLFNQKFYSVRILSQSEMDSICKTCNSLCCSDRTLQPIISLLKKAWISSCD